MRVNNALHDLLAAVLDPEVTGAMMAVARHPPEGRGEVFTPESYNVPTGLDFSSIKDDSYVVGAALSEHPRQFLGWDMSSL